MKRVIFAASLICLAAAAAQAQTVRMPILTFPVDWPAAVTTAPAQPRAQADD